MNFEKKQPMPLDSISEQVLSHSPLHYACYTGDCEVVETLLGHTFVYNNNDADAAEACLSNLVSEEDSLNGWTAAHWAAFYGHLNCLMKLNIKPHLGFDTPTHRSNTSPLHVAAQSGAVLCLKWLLQCGASKSKQDFMGDTALHKAAKAGNTDSVAMLISHGALLEVKNHRGLTPAEVADESGHPALAQYLRRAAEQANMRGTIHSWSQNFPTQLPIAELNHQSTPVSNPTTQHSASVPTDKRPFILMNGETIHNTFSTSASSETDMDGDDFDMRENEDMSAEGCVCFKPESEVVSFEENGFGFGKKRTIDMDDEEVFSPHNPYKRRCFVPISKKSHEEHYGTAQNNNIISSYNSVLAMSTDPVGDKVIPGLPQSSMMEHQASIEVQEGYDSSLIRTMNTFH